MMGVVVPVTMQVEVVVLAVGVDGGGVGFGGGGDGGGGGDPREDDVRVADVGDFPNSSVHAAHVISVMRVTLTRWSHVGIHGSERGHVVGIVIVCTVCGVLSVRHL